MHKLIALRSGAVAAALLAVLALAAAPVRAQDYLNRPITLIVPFPPGGSTTIVGRIIADKMSEVLGQSIVVDNRGGAGGTIGSRTVAKSAGDGYTILLGYTGTLAIGPSLYGNVGYDPRTDFEAVLRYGMVAPAGTPRALIDKLNKALNQVLVSDEVRRRLAIDGAEPLPSTPDEYGIDIDREEKLWGKVVKASGAKAE